MSDELTNRGVQDRALISMSEEHEGRYWTDALATGASSGSSGQASPRRNWRTSSRHHATPHQNRCG